jgi:type II secretory pathway pseudopilin PulG
MEVILCLGLFAIVIVALFTVILGGLRMQTKAEVVELASSVARQQIEAIKNDPMAVVEGLYDGRIPTAPVEEFPPPPYPTVERGRDFWTLVEVSPSDNRLWYVRVRVFSSEGEETSMETLLKR